jgi:hypothetical protein
MLSTFYNQVFALLVAVLAEIKILLKNHCEFSR